MYYRVTAIWFVHAPTEEIAILIAGNRGINQTDRTEVKQEPLPSQLAKQPTGPVRSD